jgi:hypothetical protein
MKRPLSLKVAVVLLFGAGLLFLVPGGLLAAVFSLALASGGEDTCGAMGCGWPWVFFGIGIVMTMLGIAQVSAAIGVWRLRRWARWLGAVLAGLGFTISATAWLVEFTSQQFALYWAPFTIAYAVILGGLWRWTGRATP